MVVVHEGDRSLMDRKALAEWLKRSTATIRAHCQVVGYDEAGRALYDAEACATILDGVKTRKR